MEKSCPEKEGHPPSRVTSASVYMRKKKLTPLPEPTALARALALTELTRLRVGEPKYLYREKLAQLPVSCVNSSPTEFCKEMKEKLARPG